ncbi:MAG: hypothetical protein AAGL89_11155 [Pseudomonadota bacterium]
MKKGDALDPKGLIEEAYKIDGITSSECRSIFVDWALSYDGDTHAAIPLLLDRHGADTDHPMTATLTEGLATAATPKRRGGRAARV